MTPRHPKAAPRLLVVLALGSVALGGCRDTDPASPQDAIAVEVFIETYVDLRVADLTQRSSPTIDPADRDRILVEHGVTSEDLLRFVEVHGDNVPFISAVWDSVEARYRRRQSEQFEEPDTTGSVSQS